jgi:hypothetical protein
MTNSFSGNQLPTERRNSLLALESARWRLAIIWFPASGVIAILLIGQSLGGVYGDELQRVWGWALPNFLPTLALMVSVFAADALRPYEDSVFVRGTFCMLAIGLTVFYLAVFSLPILYQPFLQPGGSVGRIALLEISNIWLGPLQGLVVISLGVLFFLKEDGKKSR